MLKFSPEYLIVEIPFSAKLTTAERKTLYKENCEKLKAAGFRPSYNFRKSDRKMAEAQVEAIKKASGVNMAINTACSVSF